jgi:hypothetical protein
LIAFYLTQLQTKAGATQAATVDVVVLAQDYCAVGAGQKKFFCWIADGTTSVSKLLKLRRRSELSSSRGFKWRECFASIACRRA